MGLGHTLTMLRQNDYELRFRYPTEEEKKQLRIINRDLQLKGKGQRRRSLRKQREQLLEAVSRGELDPDKLIQDLETIKHASEKK